MRDRAAVPGSHCPPACGSPIRSRIDRPADQPPKTAAKHCRRRHAARLAGTPSMTTPRPQLQAYAELPAPTTMSIVAPVCARRVRLPRAKRRGHKRAAGRSAQLEDPTGEYRLPPLDILALPAGQRRHQDRRGSARAERPPFARDGSRRFRVKGQIVKVRPGPVVTLYELEPAPGTKSSRVIGLADDIARSMSAAVGARRSFPAATSSASSCRTRAARRSICASCCRHGTTRTRLGCRWPRQGHRRRSGHRRSRAHAASADRRHHRIGQVGGGQHHDPVAALSPAAGSAAGFIMIDPKMLELSVYEDIPIC